MWHLHRVHLEAEDGKHQLVTQVTFFNLYKTDKNKTPVKNRSMASFEWLQINNLFTDSKVRTTLFSMINNTVKLLLSRHPWDLPKCPLNEGS